jgi:hypothetical protein
MMFLLVSGNKDKARKAALERAMNIGTLKVMDRDGDGILSRVKYKQNRVKSDKIRVKSSEMK